MLSSKKYTIAISALILSLIILIGVGSAHAQSSRLYVAGYLGLNVHGENAYSDTTAGLSGDYELDNTPTFAGALGLRLDKNWRIEGEISYRRPDFDRVDFASGGTANAGGDIATWLYMANVYYDFDFKWRNLQPFVTGGVGLAYHEFNFEDTGTALNTGGGDTFDLAFQVGGGAKYRYSDDIALTGSYRYLGTSEINAGNFNADYSTHEFRLGIEYDIPVDTFNFLK